MEFAPSMINEFVSKILIHEAVRKGVGRTQEVEIFLNYIRNIEIPHEEVELIEEELQTQEKERIRLEKKQRKLYKGFEKGYGKSFSMMEVIVFFQFWNKICVSYRSKMRSVSNQQGNIHRSGCGFSSCGNYHMS